jgi:hypothetical protein
MASLLVLNKDGEPVGAAIVRVVVPPSAINEGIDRNYITGPDGKADISISPLYAGSSAHVRAEGSYEGKTWYSAFDWPIEWVGLSPSHQTTTLNTPVEPAPIYDIWERLKQNRWLVLSGVVAIGAVGFVVRESRLWMD